MTQPLTTADPAPVASMGPGFVRFNAETGAPIQFSHPADPNRRYLLDATTTWHSLEHEWGSGFVITESGAARWNTPDALDWDGCSSVSRFSLRDGLALTVSRSVAAELTERYVFENHGTAAVSVGSIGIQTPFADQYVDARSALSEAVDAHVFCGGSWSWVLAAPMSGRGQSLGLTVTSGGLAAYSLESRNHNTMSNARGHIVLHVTDHARNPDAFGGQPHLPLEPGEQYVLEWSIGWFSSAAQFRAMVDRRARIDRVAAPVGAEVIVRAPERVWTSSPSARVRSVGSEQRITAYASGLVPVRIGDDARTEIYFHTGVEDIVRQRCGYILERQRSAERPGLLRYGFLPVDTTTGLTQSTNGWSDWTDGSERIGMPILLQRARNAGLLGQEVDDHLAGWSAFATEHLLDETAAPRRGSQDGHTGPRLYDAPWLIQFFLERYRGTDESRHLDLAVRIFDRSVELGAVRFLAISASEAWRELAELLEVGGRAGKAAEIRARIAQSADFFLERGIDLPASEVAYEQAIVAPLAGLLNDAYAITGEERFLDGLAERLPWLMAFGGPQPHARLRNIPIRHWDGFWFGMERLWGDVFPHYWGVLTASVLAQLPDACRTPDTDDVARDILHAGMINFSDDGTATCAFVLPSTIDGRPGHRADPLANDQDWHLATWLWLNSRFGVPFS